MKVVVDTGVLVEVIESTELGKKFIKLISDNKIEPILTNLTITELSYVVCRKYGINKARELVKELLDSGYFTVVDALKFADSIAEIKCIIIR